MELHKDTSISEIIESLTSEHFFKYHSPIDEPLKIKRKESGFGNYFFVFLGEKLVYSVKCSGDSESLVLSKQLLTSALEKLGYEVAE